MKLSRNRNGGFTLPEVLLDGDRRVKDGHIGTTTEKTVKYQWTLDSMDYSYDEGGNRTGGLHFRGLFAKDNTPSVLGGKFTVTASLTLSKDGYIESSYSAKGSDNSLFDTTSIDDPEGKGTAYIANLRHLQNLDNFTSGAAGKAAAIQLADIDASTVMDNEGEVIGTYEFVPIENWDLKSYKADSPKSLGTDPYSISNLKVTVGDQAGLFSGVAANFQFENIRLIDSDIQGGSYTGGLTGSAPSATFKNCQILNTKVTTSDGFAGGLAGYWWLEPSPIKFEDCRAEGIVVQGLNAAGGLAGGGTEAEFVGCTVQKATVIATNTAQGTTPYAGGLTGYISSSEGFLEDNGVYTDCHVINAEIKCQQYAAGGLVGSIGDAKGKTYVSFTGCTVEDSITSAGTYAGGLTGLSYTGGGGFEQCTVSNTEVSAKVSNYAQAGGLAGRATNTGFTECEAKGVTVSAIAYAGGLAGFGESASLSTCKAYGASVTAIAVLTGNGNYTAGLAGGLAGNVTGTQVGNCEAVNAKVTAINGQASAGGLAGQIQTGTVLSGCKVYWDNPSKLTKDTYQVIGNYAGGLVGTIERTSTIKDSFAATLVQGRVQAGGLAGNIAWAAGDAQVRISKSYADCYIQNSGDWAGGLIGIKEYSGTALTLENVYAAGFIDGPCSAAGIYGGWAFNDNGSIQNVCIAMSYTSSVTINGQLVPASWAVIPTNAYYLSSGWTSDGGRTYDQMSNLTNTMGDAFGKKTPDNTHPYNLDGNNRTGAYPFPGLTGLDHYGDWYTP